MTEPTIYVENGVGRAVMDAINLFTPGHGQVAVFQHDVHPEMQRRQFGDDWWIEDVANRGMAILTQDARLLRGSERVAIIGANARVIALGNGSYTTWEKLRCVVQHWTAAERVLAATAASAVVLTLSAARHEIP